MELRPSNAHIWLECKGAFEVSREDRIPEDKTAAEEGTRQHEILASLIKGTKQHKILASSFLDLEESDAAFAYRKIQHHFPFIPFVSEERIEILQGLRGSPDLYYVHGGQILVIDYKSGRNPVSPWANPQLGLYALGIATKHEILNQCVAKTYIVQKGKIQGYDWDTPHLMALRDKAIEAIQRPKGTTRAGNWCQRCPLIACKTRTQHVFDVFNSLSHHRLMPHEMTGEELVALLKKRKQIEATLKPLDKIESILMSRIDEGQEIQGASVEEGRKSRKWTDEATVRERFPDLIQETLMSPAQAEKLLPKETVADFVTTSSSRVVILEEDI